MKHLLSIIIYILCLMQVSCVGDNSVNTNSVAAANSNVETINDVVRLSVSTTIPLIEPKGNLVSFLVATNNSGNKLSLTGIYAQNNKGDLENISGTALIDASDCSTLQVDSACKIAIYPQTEKNYFLELHFRDDAGNNYVSRQLIGIKKPTPSNNGFMYFTDNLNLVLPQQGKNTISFPVVLDDDYKVVVTSISNRFLKTKILCKNAQGVTQYTKGTMCTLLISGSENDITTDDKIEELTIKGLKASARDENDTNQFTQNLMITTSMVGNLIVSAFNTVISPADGSVGNRQLITLFNNGVSAVNTSTLNIYAPSPITTTTGTIPCTGSIAAGGSCNFYINVTTGLVTNGQSSVTISYNNSSTINLINFTVVYIVTPASPGIQMSATGSLINTFAGAVATVPVLITNTGNVTFNNLTFNSVNTQNSAMNYSASGTTCVTGQSLAPNASCIMVVGYNPQASQAVSNVNIFPVFSYTINGTTQSYASAGLAVSYSADSTSNYVVVGDYGSVANSTAVATWAVSTAPPFVTNAIIGQALTQGAASLYVLGLSATANTLYSSSGGIIWSVDASTPGATAVLGILYDGTNYIVAGGTSTRTIRVNPSITGGTWTTQATAAAGATVNSLFLANSGYIGTLSTAANLQVSTNGTTWATSTTPGNYFTSLYDGTTYYVFGASGVSSSATNVLGTWTSRPVIAATFTARDSVFNAGLYVAVGSTSASNVVYTTTNPQSVAWTARTTPATTQLNSIVFAQSQYVAVGNTGTIITSPNATTWTTRTSGTTANLTTVYYDGTFFWAIGTAIILVSSDGITWTRATLNSIAYNGTNFITVGIAGRIYTSTDLITWTLRTSGSTNILHEVQCASPTLCMAVGNNGTILTSTTGGTTWSPSTSGTSGNLIGFVCGLTNCVTVGVNGANGVVVSASTLSSSTWSVSANPTNGLNSVSYLENASGSAGNLYVAVGAAGSIITSPDGTTWTTRTSGVAVALNSITCPGNATVGCIAVGATTGTAGVILTSTDGISWTSRTSGVNVNLNSVTYYAGNYIVAGDSNTLLTSSDGITWTARTSNILATTAVNLQGAFAY